MTSHVFCFVFVASICGGSLWRRPPAWPEARGLLHDLMAPKGERHLILGQQTVMLGRASSETNVHAVFRFVGGPKMSVSHTVHNWLGPQLTCKRYMYSLEPRTYHEYVISMYSMAWTANYIPCFNHHSLFNSCFTIWFCMLAVHRIGRRLLQWRPLPLKDGDSTWQSCISRARGTTHIRAIYSR